MADELAADLDAYVSGEDFEDGTGGEQAVEVPQDADRANQLLRALKGVRRRLDAIERLAAAEQTRIDNWRRDRRAGLDRKAAELERILEQWMRAVHERDPKVKSQALPNGTLKLSAARFQVEVTDEDRLREWLWSNRPDLLKISVEPRPGDVKAAFEAGPVVSEHEDVKWHAVMAGDEVVPGVRLAKATRDSFGKIQ